MELRFSEMSSEPLIETLPAAIYTCDSEGLITYFNRHAVRLWGRALKLNDPSDRFCGSFNLFSPEGEPLSHDHCWMALTLREDKEFHGHEIVVERPDGERISVLAYASPIRNQFDDLVGAVNVLVEITDRKRMEEARGRLSTIVESSEDAVISKTLDGTILTWNRGAERMYGYAGHEVIGRPVSILIPLESTDELPTIMERLRRGERIEHYETIRKRKDGSRINVSVTISPIRSETGVVIGASSVARDITDRIRIQEERARLLAREQEARSEAQRANRVKDLFLATVSHELRTPIQSILGWVNLLRNGHMDFDAQIHALDAIQRNAKAQVKLIGDLLDASSIIAGKLRLVTRPVELTSVLAAAIDTVRPSADAKGIRLQLDIERGPETVDGDFDRLQQVFLNLLSNAIKFTPEGGRVHVCLKRTDSDMVITISDTGAGIELQCLPHVFEAFEQASGSRPQAGLGLGLAIVRHLVEMHGGWVRAESPGRNRGASFTIGIPMMDPAGHKSNVAHARGLFDDSAFPEK